ncbi:aspartate dehydrogenase domain-containing protein [Mycolicibacterium confluentis]|uniref:aspartate dehydrogenase domain-containing protein n=1 Tax=Mycolicibacterium confluentis TaxID=28047 RepID=UPI00389907B0
MSVPFCSGAVVAGIGPDRTTACVYADPSLDRNIHDVHVRSDSVALSMHNSSRRWAPQCAIFVNRDRCS